MKSSSDVAICMPVRDRVEPETKFALENNVGVRYRLLTEIGLPVDEARNRLAERALETEAERIVWVDADAFWLPGCLERMLSWTADPSKVIGAVYGRRTHFSPVNARQSAQAIYVGFDHIRSIDGLIPCYFIGSHVLACSRALLERLGPHPWELSDVDQSEDNAFARRIREAGCAQYLDTRAWTFHVENGVMYVPGSSAYVLVDGKPERRPLPPTLPFARGRGYGSAVDAAMRKGLDSRGTSEDDRRRMILAPIIAGFEAEPNQAERFRMPTEHELAEEVAHVFGARVRRALPLEKAASYRD